MVDIARIIILKQKKISKNEEYYGQSWNVVCEMRCWSVSVGAQEKRENVYSHRRNLRQANKLTMRIEGDEAET